MAKTRPRTLGARVPLHETRSRGAALHARRGQVRGPKRVRTVGNRPHGRRLRHRDACRRGRTRAPPPVQGQERRRRGLASKTHGRPHHRHRRERHRGDAHGEAPYGHGRRADIRRVEDSRDQPRGGKPKPARPGRHRHFPNTGLPRRDPASRRTRQRGAVPHRDREERRGLDADEPAVQQTAQGAGSADERFAQTKAEGEGKRLRHVERAGGARHRLRQSQHDANEGRRRLVPRAAVDGGIRGNVEGVARGHRNLLRKHRGRHQYRRKPPHQHERRHQDERDAGRSHSENPGGQPAQESAGLGQAEHPLRELADRSQNPLRRLRAGEGNRGHRPGRRHGRVRKSQLRSDRSPRARVPMALRRQRQQRSRSSSGFAAKGKDLQPADVPKPRHGA